MKYRQTVFMCVTFSPAIIWLAPASLGFTDEYWPFTENPENILEKGIGPQDSEANFIVNDRVISFSKAKQSDYSKQQTELEKALNLARTKHLAAAPAVVMRKPKAEFARVKAALNKASNPNLYLHQNGDFVEIMYRSPETFQVPPTQLINLLRALAVILYKKQAFSMAEEKLAECAEIQKNSLNFADQAETLEYKALVQRASKDFTGAEASYLQALSIRQKEHPQGDSRTAATFMHLANLYYDKGDGVKAQKFESKAKSIATTDKRTISKRPIPTGIAPPTYWTADSISELAKDTNEGYKNHGAARDAEFTAMKELLKTLLPDEGASYIYGTAQVALDRANSLVYKKTFLEKDLGTTVIKDQPKESMVRVSDAKGIPVVLCKSELHPKVEAVIRNYARKYGFRIEDYQKTWPGIREQAKELILDMVPAVESSSPILTETNDSGEFELKEVPKGEYCIFGFLVTREKAMYWLKNIQINGQNPVRFDFLRENADILWEKNKIGPTALPTELPSSGTGRKIDGLFSSPAKPLGP